MVFQLLLLPFLSALLHVAGGYYHLMTSPEPPAIEMGTNFTATCSIVNTTLITADDLYWNLTGSTVPRRQYAKVNATALNVTIAIREDTPPWLICLCSKDSVYIRMHPSKFQHGIFLQTGYHPDKPENLSCVAVQQKSIISPKLRCRWDTRGRQTKTVPTTSTLHVKYSGRSYNRSTAGNEAEVTFDIFPNFMQLEVWVEARNKLGQVESDHLVHYANSFVKTSPPSDLQVLAEKNFSTSLLVNWTQPIAKAYVRLMFQVRFRPRGSTAWSYVPLWDIGKGVESFRLQGLQPDTFYSVQVRCKYSEENQGHWSDWSVSGTQRTPEDRPSGKPDLWRTIRGDGAAGRNVTFVVKDPRPTNGKITSFKIRVQKAGGGDRRPEWESVAVDGGDGDGGERRVLKSVSLPSNLFVTLHAVAVNSVGASPDAFIGVPAEAHGLGAVQDVKVWPDGGRLRVEWRQQNVTGLKEVVVQWSGGGQWDWQRESPLNTNTTIKGSLKRFVCYTVSVFPVFSGWVGQPVDVQTFLEEGVPGRGPDAQLQGDSGRNGATLVWDQVLEPDRRGFITHYTLFYRNGEEVHAKELPARATSYTLTGLAPNTKYDVWVQASTLRGSKNGSTTYFTTRKYAPREVEGIVVGVSLGLLFTFLLTALLCFYKRDLIKENFWPQIPDPGESTIGTWSPDYSLKAETPKENCLSGISVLDMDMCDARCVFEEDKASLALKKDKYLSEEHSSGIGGSSCMSSPRQSVSDSDEGGDVADTTASTVQYSSVVASGGYKGQTPAPQAPQAAFSRSESTQPLLDSEENPDVAPDGGRPFRQPRFPQEMELQDVVEPLDFCPLDEDGEEAEPPASSYMPQLGGYRPQCQ